jgi:hypothetical protein
MDTDSEKKRKAKGGKRIIAAKRRKRRNQKKLTTDEHGPVKQRGKGFTGQGYKMFFIKTQPHPEGEANCDLKIRVYPRQSMVNDCLPGGVITSNPNAPSDNSTPPGESISNRGIQVYAGLAGSISSVAKRRIAPLAF